MTSNPVGRQSPAEPPSDGEAPQEGPDWGKLIEDAGARVRPAVVAQEFVGSLTSASQPQKFRCDDGRLYAVKFRNNGHGDGRAIFTEQVVGLLAQHIDAPVPEVRPVQVTGELLASMNLQIGGHPAAPGLHHGSLWQDGFGDKTQFLQNTHANRPAFAALHLLYSWLHCHTDHQLIYRNAAPNDPLSVDHTCFLPNGPSWTVQDLRDRQDSVQHDPAFAGANLTRDEHQAALDRLDALTAEMIATAVASPAEDWGVPLTDRLALAEYVARRRVKLLESFGRKAV
jgi:hypothetical protein